MAKLASGATLGMDKHDGKTPDYTWLDHLEESDVFVSTSH